MEEMRTLLKSVLGRSLEALAEEDRLAAAWTVACGKAMADHGSLMSYVEGIVTIQVTDKTWLKQMMSMRGQLTSELGKIAGVRVREIHFQVKDNRR
jgi:predicted nucleic acid-binding Zn ribbon protein